MYVLFFECWLMKLVDLRGSQSENTVAIESDIPRENREVWQTVAIKDQSRQFPQFKNLKHCIVCDGSMP